MANTPRHIAIAQSEGPAAGLRAYLRTNAPTSAERRADILSSKDKLVRYCQIFPAATNGVAPVRAEIDNEEKLSILQRVAAQLGIDLNGRTDGVQVEATEPTPAPATTPAKATTSAPIAKGESFLYHGTNSVSSWEVVSVHKSHVKASNGKRVSNWKHTTVASLISKGKIDKI